MLPGGVFRNEELFELQRHLGRPITWTALLTVKGLPYHEKVVAEHDAARAEGVSVWPQVSCRPLVFQMNMEEPFTLNMRPSFKALMDVDRDARIEAYADPTWREQAWEDVSGRGGMLPFNWPALTVAESDSHPELVGRAVVEVAEERGVTPLDVVLDVSLDDDLRTRFNSTLANDDDEAIAWLLPRDGMLIGLADSGAHVSQLCDACFATDLLGNWVRDRQVMPLERAVHKLTGEPAEVFGLADRGVIEPGRAADLVVFDPATVAPGPLRRIVDFPADGERLTADSPEGVRHVVVNGVAIRVDGQMVPEAQAVRPGRLLR
jgi:N-acyl-D-aspartate/D-glutamate deacylase